MRLWFFAWDVLGAMVVCLADEEGRLREWDGI